LAIRHLTEHTEDRGEEFLHTSFRIPRAGGRIRGFPLRQRTDSDVQGHAADEFKIIHRLPLGCVLTAPVTVPKNIESHRKTLKFIDIRKVLNTSVLQGKSFISALSFPPLPIHTVEVRGSNPLSPTIPFFKPI
jgi:hypothetical protein